jgi:hypothetical protein
MDAIAGHPDREYVEYCIHKLDELRPIDALMLLRKAYAEVDIKDRASCSYPYAKQSSTQRVAALGRAIGNRLAELSSEWTSNEIITSAELEFLISLAGLLQPLCTTRFDDTLNVVQQLLRDRSALDNPVILDTVVDSFVALAMVQSANDRDYSHLRNLFRELQANIGDLSIAKEFQLCAAMKGLGTFADVESLPSLLSIAQASRPGSPNIRADAINALALFARNTSRAPEVTAHLPTIEAALSSIVGELSRSSDYGNDISRREVLSAAIVALACVSSSPRPELFPFLTKRGTEHAARKSMVWMLSKQSDQIDGFVLTFLKWRRTVGDVDGIEPLNALIDLPLSRDVPEAEIEKAYRSSIVALAKAHLDDSLEIRQTADPVRINLLRNSGLDSAPDLDANESSAVIRAAQLEKWLSWWKDYEWRLELKNL